MGSYRFTWERPANEVYVTGTFDDWGKTIKMEKKGDGFEKTVELPQMSGKIYYKFVVDGNWTTNANAPQEKDETNNINNVLKPEDLKSSSSMTGGVGAATISSVGPNSTTAQLAGKVPKEGEKSTEGAPSSDVPGGFPETPSQENQQFGVKPVPASDGAGNPVHLKPGEKVPDPSSFTSKDTTTADTLDKAGYENSGDDAQALAGAAKPTIQSSGAGSTTAALAAQVPKEPKREAQIIPGGSAKGQPISPDVPEVVQESIADAKVAPEAAANNEAVVEKNAVENELLKDVKPTDAKGEPAPAASAATTDKAPGATTAGASASTPSQDATQDAAKDKGPDSRDISPLSHPKGQKPVQPLKPSEPTVTTGAASASTPAKSEPEPASSASKTDKKAKRGSIFGRLKDKLKHKDDK